MLSSSAKASASLRTSTAAAPFGHRGMTSSSIHIIPPALVTDRAGLRSCGAVCGVIRVVVSMLVEQLPELALEAPHGCLAVLPSPITRECFRSRRRDEPVDRVIGAILDRFASEVRNDAGLVHQRAGEGFRGAGVEHTAFP